MPCGTPQKRHHNVVTSWQSSRRLVHVSVDWYLSVVKLCQQSHQQSVSILASATIACNNSSDSDNNNISPPVLSTWLLSLPIEHGWRQDRLFCFCPIAAASVTVVCRVGQSIQKHRETITIQTGMVVVTTAKTAPSTPRRPPACHLVPCYYGLVASTIRARLRKLSNHCCRHRHWRLFVRS